MNVFLDHVKINIVDLSPWLAVAMAMIFAFAIWGVIVAIRTLLPKESWDDRFMGRTQSQPKNMKQFIEGEFQKLGLQIEEQQKLFRVELIEALTRWDEEDEVRIDEVDQWRAATIEQLSQIKTLVKLPEPTKARESEISADNI